LLRLGLPAAGQILLEVGVFATATTLAGRLTPESIAAHHIVLNIAGTTFMVPLGMSSAGAVMVGQAIGSGEPARARRAGWMTIASAAVFMSAAAATLLLWPGAILGAFTRNTDVLAMASQLLFAAAAFQIFDGVQVTATGVLRGSGNTKTPMFANLVAHWLLGLPAGYFLCFALGLGVVGIWIGLSAGLIAVAGLLLYVWSRAPV
jgi:multidrug resistance protein, MATE family